MFSQSLICHISGVFGSGWIMDMILDYRCVLVDRSADWFSIPPGVDNVLNEEGRPILGVGDINQ